ncbi:hypothetical protein N6H18_06820 [Reichenbachiella agarivorans]|uniref:Outer membrane protein beta-barrel family protein n=1 Tax=Reichenbachiella agarivorans TaxID=2979464 RepID=A0ABY6CTK8_9BACT|nr:hypothetical protein [Reichenbachiella agarivorans]UXP33664.1 hypothetical protein N6H18_06820 [Reichenbachiella agarivorans]
MSRLSIYIVHRLTPESLQGFCQKRVNSDSIRSILKEFKPWRVLYNERLYSAWQIAIVIILLIALSGNLAAQNLESIGKGDAITLSGGINVNQVFYQANGVEDRRDPYNYFLSGNLNLSLYGWSVPVSFSYSNQNASFQQPFNQYGMSPTYKWVTAHLGYRSMTFSKYTLNGHLFLGAGLELTPSEKVKVAVMYGRLQKEVELDTTQVGNLPAYRRMGGGAKVTLGGNSHSVDFSFFKAADDDQSLKTDLGTIEIFPEENFVLGMGLSSTLFKNLSFKGEVAYSAISTNTQSLGVEADHVYNKLSFAFQPRVSSSYYTAMNAALQYQFEKSTFGVAYERVDPGYRTLGAYYFNNDLESIALTHSSQWLNQRLSVSARGGLQRNNLDNQEMNSMNRWSGSLSLNYQVTPKIVTTANYSNFSTVVNFRTPEQQYNQVTPYDNLDTLNYQQISQNASLGVNFMLGQNKERRQNLNMNMAYQQSAEEQGGESKNMGSKYYNLNSSYSMSLQPSSLILSLSGNVNVSEAATNRSLIYGPSLSTRKTLGEKKASVMGSISYNVSETNDKLNSSVLNLRLGGNYALREKHQFNLNITAVNRYTPNNDTQRQFREFVAELGYNFNFSSQ